MGHVIGAESAGRKSFLEGRGDLLGAISAEQIKEFLKLAEERTVRQAVARPQTNRGYAGIRGV